MAGGERSSAHALSRETGVAQATLSRWLREASTIAAVPGDETDPKPKSRALCERSADEKMRLVLEAARLSEEELGAFLRREGLHEADLDEWREAMLAGLTPPSNKQVRSQDARRVRQLEQELRRKEKALAEAAALLVLQKKSRPFGGTRTTTQRRTKTNDARSRRRSRRIRSSTNRFLLRPRHPGCERTSHENRVESTAELPPRLVP